MKTYDSSEDFILEMRQRAWLFIQEFRVISERDKDLLVEGVDRTPAQMLAYQLGWMNLIQQWE